MRIGEMTFGEYRSDREKEREREEARNIYRRYLDSDDSIACDSNIERVWSVFANVPFDSLWESGDVFLIGNFRRQ